MKRFDDEHLLPLEENEDSLIDAVLEALSGSFDIRRQVGGTYINGKRMRIDTVLVPKDKENWKDQDIALGVEFKSCFLSETRELTGALGQLIDYSLTTWDDFGQLPIFVCPGLRPPRTESRSDFTEGYRYCFSRVMKEFNIGELLPHSYYGWSLVMAGTHDMWTKRTGISEGKNWSLKRKYGNRGVGARK
jgi:hypothetical protein